MWGPIPDQHVRVQVVRVGCVVMQRRTIRWSNWSRELDRQLEHTLCARNDGICELRGQRDRPTTTSHAILKYVTLTVVPHGMVPNWTLILGGVNSWGRKPSQGLHICIFARRLHFDDTPSHARSGNPLARQMPPRTSSVSSMSSSSMSPVDALRMSSESSLNHVGDPFPKPCPPLPGDPAQSPRRNWSSRGVSRLLGDVYNDEGNTAERYR